MFMNSDPVAGDTQNPGHGPTETYDAGWANLTNHGGRFTPIEPDRPATTVRGLPLPVTDFKVGDWAAPELPLRIDNEEWPRQITEIVRANPLQNISAHVVFDGGLPIRLDVLVHCEGPE